MSTDWRSQVPRKLRRVSSEYIISIPKVIAQEYPEDQLFQVNVVNGSIILTPYETVGNDSGRAA